MGKVFAFILSIALVVSLIGCAGLNRPASKSALSITPSQKATQGPVTTIKPTPKPTLKSTPGPTIGSAPSPADKPTAKPSFKPLPKPSLRPTQKPAPKPTQQPAPKPTPIQWKLKYDETFDAPFNEPKNWTEQKYDKSDPYYVDEYSEGGDFFIDKGGQTFLNNLSKFRSFRKSYTYGQDGWLTVELYGRDSNKDGVPETGGTFVNDNGKAKLISTRNYDAGIIRSTNALPSRYRVEVTVSDINFGGEKNGSWNYDGTFNGYHEDAVADPWRFSDNDTTPVSATNENGVYFLCITDYPKPAPHNNVFIHHHRKVVMDSDNNNYDGSSWSYVWNPNTHSAVMDGSHYVNMLWLNGEDFGDDWTGNSFVSYTPGGWMYDATFLDKYLDNNTYTFSIERDGKSYTTTISGTFYYGGKRTYKASRKFTDSPVTWHFNQNPEELNFANYNQKKTFNGNTWNTWPSNSSYPDYFFFGDPHINYYEGTAEFDDVKLYLPKG